jgi:hypothetical protein
MPWFIYLNDYFIPTEVKAYTIDDAVRASCALLGSSLAPLIVTASMRSLMRSLSSFGEVMRALLIS